MTKLRNRSFFDDELNRLERKQVHPVAMVVIDLNGLKQVNDERGHRAGDALLRRTGEVLAKAAQVPATAARIGGDEFAVLIPGGDEHAAETFLATLHELVELNNQFHSGDPLACRSACDLATGERRAACTADKLMCQRRLFTPAEHDRRRVERRCDRRRFTSSRLGATGGRAVGAARGAVFSCSARAFHSTALAHAGPRSGVGRGTTCRSCCRASCSILSAGRGWRRASIIAQ